MPLILTPSGHPTCELCLYPNVITIVRAHFTILRVVCSFDPSTPSGPLHPDSRRYGVSLVLLACGLTSMLGFALTLFCIDGSPNCEELLGVWHRCLCRRRTADRAPKYAGLIADGPDPTKSQVETRPAASEYSDAVLSSLIASTSNRGFTWH